jgi:tRNA(adenine34) deaminase
MTLSDHEIYMSQAMREAEQGKINGDWPFGAVVILNGKTVGRGHATDKTTGDVTDHAEIAALRDACRNLKTNSLYKCTIYCSNEPCLMCAATIFQSGITDVVIGVSRDDLPRLLRARKLKIDDLAIDSGHKINITRGILKDKILALFNDISK